MMVTAQGGDSGVDQHEEKAVILCELAVALVPSLDQSGTNLLYKVRPGGVHQHCTETGDP